MPLSEINDPERLKRINAALVGRVERSMEQQENAFSLFQTAISLEGRIRARTEELRGALRRLTEPLPATLLVNPEDAELVRASLADLSVEHGGELSVREERRVERGGCVVQTQAGEVDAQISAQLGRVAKVVARGTAAA